DVVVGFGGYPSVPPVVAARLLRQRPRVILHEGNAVLGQANRGLARFADHIALSMARTEAVPAGTATTLTGIPLRAEIAALHGADYHAPDPCGPVRLLVTGGSLGARVLSSAVPAAIAMLPAALRARLLVTQQCRAEDLEGVRAAYAGMGVRAELAPFLDDMARRLAESHFVIARAGASTVAELAVAGRPALLIPLPSSDSHQRHNAVAADAGMLDQAELAGSALPLADVLAHRLDCPDMLTAGAHAIAQHGIPDAARRLADLVEFTASQERPSMEPPAMKASA
ncbi:MAG: UDP-N-acetylglucosamine--N-acetylmuramyl-(pentapeptide) pyrophosphoryl-undecaprenol N-acetylglucosamine transferase, partial [Janthinobacterium lividum]